LFVHFLMQTYLNQRKILFKKALNMIQDPTVNQHEPKSQISIINMNDFRYHQQASYIMIDIFN